MKKVIKFEFLFKKASLLGLRTFFSKREDPLHGGVTWNLAHLWDWVYPDWWCFMKHCTLHMSPQDFITKLFTLKICNNVSQQWWTKRCTMLLQLIEGDVQYVGTSPRLRACMPVQDFFFFFFTMKWTCSRLVFVLHDFSYIQTIMNYCSINMSPKGSIIKPSTFKICNIVSQQPPAEGGQLETLLVEVKFFMYQLYWQFLLILIIQSRIKISFLCTKNTRE